MFLVLFGCILFVTFAVVLLLSPADKPKHLETRLNAVVSVQASDQGMGDLTPFEQESVNARAIAFLYRFQFTRQLQLLILHSGSTATVESIVLTSGLLAAGFGLVARFFLGTLPFTLVGVALGGYVRYGLLRWKKTRRLNAFDAGLADAMELMARALRAGHSTGSAIEIVADQSVPPIDSEFRTCFNQQKLGIPFRDALLQMGDRVPSKDLHFVITAVLIQRETGGDLTEILDRTTEVIRERARIEGEVRTYTAQGRLTGWILGLLPLALLVLINLMTPGYSHILFVDPIGHLLLYAGAGMITIGTLIIRKIVDIKV